MSKAAVMTPALAVAPPAPSAAPRRAGQRSAVARWKRQLTWFAGAVTTLVVAVAAISATSMWHVISEVAHAERVNEARSRAAVDARLAVLEVDRLLSQTMAEEDAARVRAAAVASIAAASRLEDAVTALRVALPGVFFAAQFRAAWLAPASLALMTATMLAGATARWSRRVGGYWLPVIVLVLLIIFGVKFG